MKQSEVIHRPIVPEHLWKALNKRAKLNRRTAPQELEVILEEALSLQKPAIPWHMYGKADRALRNDLGKEKS